MARLLSKGGREYRFAGLGEGRGGEAFLEFKDEFYAFSFLSELADDPFNQSLLRQIAEENALVMALPRMSDERLLKYLASELVSGRIAIGLGTDRERHHRGPSKSEVPPGGETQDEGDEEEGAEPPPEKEELTWIKFQVLDHETGDPVRGVTLHVKLADGKPKTGRTDGHGIIEFTDIPSGTCDIERMIDPDALEVVSVG